ncbi:MAG: hypothetical protein QXG65_00760 [Thermoplasmata archaeon]
MTIGPKPPRHRVWARGAPWCIAGAILVVAALAGPLSGPVHFSAGVPVGRAHAVPAGPPPRTVIVVNMTDAPAFVPSRISVDSGANVTLHLVNEGNYTHTFTLARQAGVTLSRSWTPAQLDSYFAQNGSFVNVSVAAGASANASFLAPVATAPLAFTYVSLVPYQFQAGMAGTLTVKPTIGGNATLSDNTTDALSFVPSALALNSSGIRFPINVTITVTNLGGLVHTWSLVPQPGVNVTPSNFSSYFGVHPALANLTVPSNGAVTGSFVVSQPGVYMFICEEPGHFQNGMYGFLYVDVPVPPPVVVSTAIVSAWVLAVALGLIGIGAILATVTAYTGRFPKPPKPGDGHH